MLAHKAYYGRELSLPKQFINGIDSMKRTLEFPYNKETSIKAWDENSTHIMVPREFIDVTEYKDLPFPIESLCPTEFPRIEVERTYDLRDYIQEEACEALLGGSGLLVLSCGKGKTVISLHAWAIYGVPGIVVVPTVDLAYQWKSRIIEHTNIKEEDIGWIQGKPENWSWRNKPISIAILKSTSMYIEGFTEEFNNYYGVAIYDEVHRLGAPMFNIAATICSGRRWGLSATPFRRDGLDQIYRYHLGKLLYKNTTQENIPKVYFLRVDTVFGTSEEKKVSARGEINFSKLVTWLSENEYRNNVLEKSIKSFMQDGRELLVLSDRVNHLKYLHSKFEDSGIIHGGVKGKNREEVLVSNKLVFASNKIAKEGLDKKTLNTVIITMPLSDEGTFIQIMGRAQRSSDPVVMILEDTNVGMCKSMCNNLRTILNRLKYKHYNMGVLL